MNGGLVNTVSHTMVFKIMVLFLTLLLTPAGHGNEALRVDSGLSEKEIAQMELRLFNELQVRIHSWEGYSRERRFNLIKDMDDKGYELAGLALRLFPFLGQRMKFDEDAYKNLQKLADDGDAGAACLFAEAITYWNRKKEPQAQKDKQGRAQYVQSAADKDQADCVAWVAGWYLGGHGPKVVDIPLGKKIFLKAAMLGYQQSQLSLAHSYLNGRGNYSKDYAKALCWFEVAKQADTGAIYGSSPYIYNLIKNLEQNPPEFYLDTATFCQQPVSKKSSSQLRSVNVEGMS